MTLPAHLPSVSLQRASLSQNEIDGLFAQALGSAAPFGVGRGFPILPERAMELLELGANPNLFIGERHQRPLHLAAYEPEPGGLELMKALLRHGADPLFRVHQTLRQPLHDWAYACSESTQLNAQAEDKLIALARAGADLNAKDNYAHTPLSFLCFNTFHGERDRQQALLVRRLVSLGANPNAPGFMGLAPFELAAIDYNNDGGGVAVLGELLSLGAQAPDAMLSRIRRDNPSEEFLLFLQSLRDQRALESSTSAPLGRALTRCKGL